MKSFFFLLFFGFAGLMAEAAGAPSLSWNQCVELLRQNNAEYKAAEWTYRSTEAQELGAASGFYPSLAGALNYNQTKNSTAGETFPSSTVSGSSYSASLSLSQNLFAGLKDSYKTSQARANSRVAQAQFQISKAKISNDFINAYQNYLTSLESQKLAQNIVQRRQDDLRMVQLRFESGRENKGSALLSQAYLEQAQYELMQARHATELSQISLAYFLGVPSEDINRVSDPVPSHVDPRETVNFEELANQTPEHQQILATVDANLAGIGVARSNFFPSLSLTGTVGRNGPDFFPDQTDRWSVGASISIPLFDGGRDVSAVQAATATRNSSLSHRQTVDQDTVTSLKQAYQKYLESIEKLKVDETFQKAALVRAEVARSQYNNGLISFTDWDQIENDLITRQKSYLQSKKDRVLSESAWKQAQGQGVLP